MPDDVLALTKAERERLSALYLAKYACDGTSPRPSPSPTEGVVPCYHHELATVLRSLGLTFRPARELDHLLIHGAGYNYVFTVFNRAPFRNSEVFVASVCEYLGLAYLGAPPHIRTLAEDKHLFKTLVSQLGLPTAPWRVYRSDDREPRPPSFSGPYFIKPRFGAASETITDESTQDDWNGTQRVVARLLQEGVEVLVEQFVPGRNVTLPVVSGLSPPFLPCVEDICASPGGVLTYRQNRFLEEGMRRQRFDNEKVVSRIIDIGRTLLEAVAPIDYFRVDFRVSDHDHVPFILELNVCCNLGSHSNVAFPAHERGISHEALVGHIIAYSARRQGALRE